MSAATLPPRTTEAPAGAATAGAATAGTVSAEATAASPIAPSDRERRRRVRQKRALRGVLNLEDFAPRTRRALPDAVYGYVSGGSEDERSVRENRRAFGDWQFIPRMLRDVSHCSQRVSLFGRTYDSPFAIAPMGASAVVSYEADNRMARAARALRIPFTLSANSITPLEEVIRHNPDAWFNAYQKPEADNIRDMCARVAGAGYDTFVLTVDTPVGSNRENNLRSGYTMPLRPSPRLVLDTLRSPSWLGGTFARTLLRRGMPSIENVDPHDRYGLFSRRLAMVTGHPSFSWRQVELIRSLWKGHFVLKGILAPEDARIARESGVDGIVVSNHGGRQLDGAIAPIRMVPEIKREAGNMTVLVDSGFRRGTDVLKALALGADAVLIGRPFLQAATLAGAHGVAHAIRLLRREIDTDLALLGIPELSALTPELLRRIAPAA